MYRISITYNMYNVHDIYQLSAPCTEYSRCRYSYSLRTYNCTCTEYSGLQHVQNIQDVVHCTGKKVVQDIQNVQHVHCTGSKTCTGYLGRTRFTLYSVQEVKHVQNEKGQE